MNNNNFGWWTHTHPVTWSAGTPPWPVTPPVAWPTQPTGTGSWPERYQWEQRGGNPDSTGSLGSSRNRFYGPIRAITDFSGFKRLERLPRGIQFYVRLQDEEVGVKPAVYLYVGTDFPYDHDGFHEFLLLTGYGNSNHAYSYFLARVGSFDPTKVTSDIVGSVICSYVDQNRRQLQFTVYFIIDQNVKKC